MPVPPPALEATSDNCFQPVLENSGNGLIVLDYLSELAGPSRRQSELLPRLAREYGGRFLLVTVNTDRERDIARDFEVKSLPACKLFRHGKPVEQVHGMQTEADYRELIERHLVPLADQVQAAALKAWQGGDRDEGDPGARRRRIGRGLMGVLDTLSPDDERVRRYRQHLFDH